MAKQINNRNSGFISQKAASTAFAVGDFVTVNSSGFLIPGGSGTVKGICNETITSADADYASTRDLNYTAFKADDVFEVPVATGTATQTLVGELVDVDATDKGAADVTASTNNQLEVVRVINDTTILCKIVPQVA